MYPQPNIACLETELQALTGRLSGLQKAEFDAQLAAFIADNGCNPCRGRGWVVVWDTLDCLDGSCAETQTCRACGGRKGVLHPQNNKYDRWHVGSTWECPETQDIVAAKAAISSAEYALSKEQDRWKVKPGCIVAPARKSTAKGALPLGVEATVIKFCENPNKVWVKDAGGQSYWPTVGSLRVACPKDSAHGFAPAPAPAPVKAKENDVPQTFKVKVGKKTEKAALVTLVRDGTFASEQVWLPYSQVPALQGLSGDAVISIPDWLVKAKGIEGYASAAAVPAPQATQAAQATQAPVAAPPARSIQDALDILFC